jgi:hypothetical protein
MTTYAEAGVPDGTILNHIARARHVLPELAHPADLCKPQTVTLYNNLLVKLGLALGPRQIVARTTCQSLNPQIFENEWFIKLMRGGR